MSKSKKKLGVVGAGVMGQAIMSGLLESGRFKTTEIWASVKTDESKKKIKNQKIFRGLEVFSQNNKGRSKYVAETGILLVCVKPQRMAEVLQNFSGQVTKDTLVISIAAGVTIQDLEASLEGKCAVIRSMPNTPAIVRQAVTVFCGGKSSKPFHVKSAQEIFSSIGMSFELEEKYFDAITGLSGSGPAYLYLIMEALADGGVKAGLPRAIALKAIAQTVLGAATMVKDSIEKDGGRHPAALKDDVTTPAGCTIAALLVMEDGKIRSILARAVEEAARIASGLGK
jgi:pyrroline-5-carboxylate reductase